jgi:Domain of unknown function (DUF4838)/Concanavalin A-like lectin/glucanases superfamily/Glycosyl hydrolase family 67 N-terminus
MRHLWIIVLLMGCIFTSSAKNLIKNGNFESGKKYWGILGQQGSQFSAIDNKIKYKGKNSYRLGGLPNKKYAAIMQPIKGMNTLDQIKQPLKISVWMKTKDIIYGPGKGKAEFTFWTSKAGGGNGKIINIASVAGTSDWKKYSITITPEMIQKWQEGRKGDDHLVRWSLRANLWSQDGTMWIDNVRCDVSKSLPVDKNSANSYKYDKTIAITQKNRQSKNHQAKFIGDWITLFTDSDWQADIVINNDASPAVEYAANELAEWLTKMTGKYIDITNESNKPVAIYLGNTAQARKMGIDVKNLPRDAFQIRSAKVGDQIQICIAGRDDQKIDPKKRLSRYIFTMFERGTLFGVYDFLERFAGIRFYFYNDLTIPVPRAKSIKIMAMDIYEAPDFDKRMISCRTGELPDGVSAFKQNGGLSDKASQKKYYKRTTSHQFRLRLQTKHVPFSHGLHHMWFQKTERAKHPEYFALEANEKRATHPNFCMLNPSFQDKVVDTAIKYYNGMAAPAAIGRRYWEVSSFQPGYVSIMPRDGYAPNMICRDKFCKKFANMNDNMSEYVFTFTKDVAKKLKQRGRKERLTQMAYNFYRFIPKTDIPDNVDVSLAITGPWQEMYPASQKKNIALLKAWYKKLGNRKLYSWNYAHNMDFPLFPSFGMRIISSFYKKSAPYIKGALMQSVNSYRFHYYLNYYVFAKTAWDNDTDVEELLTEHHNKMFGAAAPIMSKFYDRLEELWEKECLKGEIKNLAYGPRLEKRDISIIWKKAYSEREVAALGEMLDKALAVVKGKDTESYDRINFIKETIYKRLADGRKKITEINKTLDKVEKIGTWNLNKTKEISTLSEGAVDNISIEFSMKLNSYPRSYAIRFLNKWKRNVKTAQWAFYLWGGNKSISGRNAKHFAVSGTANNKWQTISPTYKLELNKWYHILWTYNSSLGGRLYINGKSAGPAQGKGKLYSSKEPMRINHGLDAELKNLIIYKGIFSDSKAKKITAKAMKFIP